MKSDDEVGDVLMTDREIATLWGVDRSAVWQMRNRAMKKIRQALLDDPSDVDVPNRTTSESKQFRRAADAKR